jgi:hypothetical protein
MRSLLAEFKRPLCSIALSYFDVKEGGKVAKITCASFFLAPARRGLRSMLADRSQEKTHETPRRPLHRGWAARQPALVSARAAAYAQTFGNDAFGEP